MYAILIFFIFLTSCSTDESAPVPKGEFIYRKKGENYFKPEPTKSLPKITYPWQEGPEGKGNFPKITKEYFRCKGSSLNPPKTDIKNGQPTTYFDCGGSDKHSLPLYNGKENVYPILIDLLNWIQMRTNKKVVITAGHRCPDHNFFVDSSPRNQVSKHLIGAEVSFYVQGLENHPGRIIQLIQDFYQQDPHSKGDKRYTEFKRYEKDDTGTSIQPWMNHEVFIKVYPKKEGRDFDNRHPYPYLSIQVRVDRMTNERVIYTWDKAYNNFLRY